MQPIELTIPGTFRNAGELRADALGVQFQGLAALSDISLCLVRDEILGLIGPNGAGKTTFVNCLTGFQKPSQGGVFLGEEATRGWTPVEFRKGGVARTFQAGRLFGDMSIIENIEIAGLSLGVDRKRLRSHAADVLDWIGLAGKGADKASSLAYTDQRRLGIARALVPAPNFLLLDEPAAGMSDAECEDLMALVTEIPKLFGCGVLLIEHNMHVVMSICHRIHVLDGGRTLAQGAPAEIQRNEAVMAAYLGLDAP